jgi:hypothetical protein
MAHPLYIHTPVERAPGTHWIGGCLDPVSGLDDAEKRTFMTLPGLELRPLARLWIFPKNIKGMLNLKNYGSSDAETSSGRSPAVMPDVVEIG